MTRRLLIAAAVFFVLAMMARGGKHLIIRAAEKQLAQVQGEITHCGDRLCSVDDLINGAREKHRNEYVEGLTIGTALKHHDKAGAVIRQVVKERHPDQIMAGVRSAQAALKTALDEAKQCEERITYLDSALAGYTTSLHQLPQRITSARQQTVSLEQAGYYSRHFVEARKLIAVAHQRQSDAKALLAKKDKQGRPPYVEVFESAVDGIKLADQAHGLAQGVPRLRDANESRGDALAERIGETERRWYDAMAAAKSLRAYPNYDCEDRVQQRHGQLAQINGRLRLALEYNSMRIQRFDEASGLLAEAEGTLGKVREVFESAVARWESVRSAIRLIPSAKDEAETQIKRAQRHINDNSQNSQGDAERLLRQAKTSFSNGEALEDSDPPRSLAAYREADDEAERAYREVDTSVEVTTPSTNYTSSGSTFSSTSSPTSSGGYGGGSFGGGSSPSGGGFGGPSGGGYGGPSGGGYGGGGL